MNWTASGLILPPPFDHKTLSIIATLQNDTWNGRSVAVNSNHNVAFAFHHRFGHFDDNEGPLRLRCSWQWTCRLLYSVFRRSERMQASSHRRESTSRMGRWKRLLHSRDHSYCTWRPQRPTSDRVERDTRGRVYNRYGSLHASGLRRGYSATV